MGGDRINYPFDTSTPTVDSTTITMLWNSVLSTENAKFFTIDIANFYLGTPLERPEYMRLAMKVLPQEVVQKYNLKEKETDGWVYVRISRGMYGLPHAGLLANKEGWGPQDTTSVNTLQACGDMHGDPSYSHW